MRASGNRGGRAIPDHVSQLLETEVVRDVFRGSMNGRCRGAEMQSHEVEKDLDRDNNESSF